MTTLAEDWTEGYVAEIEYTSGFYQELAPSLLSFAALVAGYQAPPIDRPFTCFELGCGKGISANLIAAANPAGRFYANDFNPAHIVFARALAADARLENVTFLEKSFAELGGEELPDFDYITLHGVYSWVSAENRRATGGDTPADRPTHRTVDELQASHVVWLQAPHRKGARVAKG